METFVADAIYIDASPARVFSALIEPDEVLEWLDLSEVVIAPGPGGEYRFTRTDGSRTAGVIEVLDSPRELAISDVTWELGEAQRGPMRIGFLLEARDDGCWISVRQDGLDAQSDWHEYAMRTRREWVRATVALKRLIEQI